MVPNRRFILSLSLGLILAFIPIRSAFSQEEIHYKKFKLENTSCDVGIIYRNSPAGMQVGVSAIATGKGAEFRKWKVSDIRLGIDGNKIRPDKEGRFYAKEESFFRVPAAVLFAIIGTQIDVGGSDLQQGIAKAGMAVGLGLLVLQAHGEITGLGCLFKIDAATADKIMTDRDAIEITMEDEEMHLRETVKIGMIVPAAPAKPRFDYKSMNRAELGKLVTTLEGEVASLEKDQASYKYGVDPEYDAIQRRIEELQTERGVAYKKWFERR